MQICISPLSSKASGAGRRGGEGRPRAGEEEAAVAAAREKKTCCTAMAHAPAPEEEGGRLASSSAGELDAAVGELALCSPPATPPCAPPSSPPTEQEGGSSGAASASASGHREEAAWIRAEQGRGVGGGAARCRAGRAEQRSMRGPRWRRVGVARRQGGATVAALCGGGPSEPE
jgi:hypothetical protein